MFKLFNLKTTFTWRTASSCWSLFLLLVPHLKPKLRQQSCLAFGKLVDAGCCGVFNDILCRYALSFLLPDQQLLHYILRAPAELLGKLRAGEGDRLISVPQVRMQVLLDMVRCELLHDDSP